MRDPGVDLSRIAALAGLGMSAGREAEEQDKHISMLVRGGTNIATCWFEVPKQIYVVSQQRDAGAGILFGPLKGACFAIARLGAGIYEGTLFFLPKYEPVMDPPTVWPFEEAGTLASK